MRPQIPLVEKIKRASEFDAWRMPMLTLSCFWHPEWETVLISDRGLYLTKADWLELRDELDRFFACVDDAEILEHNAQEMARQLEESRNPIRPLREERGRVPKPGFVYLLKADNGLYKIGKAKEIDSRLTQIKPALPYELELVVYYQTADMTYSELHWHEHFADKRKNGEWFALTETDVKTFKASSMGMENCAKRNG